jgi:signal transduction histidine kinase
VTITDTGQGILEENVSKVFDPFFTTKEIGKGTGLGLSVCYNIIKQHGGEISLTSSVEKETKVTVSFPVIPYDN